MTEGIKATATTLHGDPAVQVQPTNVPKGNLGGAGTITAVESKQEAKEIAKAINDGTLDPSQIRVGTPKEGEAKKFDSPA